MQTGLAFAIAALSSLMASLASGTDLASCRSSLSSLEWDAGDTKHAANEAEDDCRGYRLCSPDGYDDCSSKLRKCRSSTEDLKYKLVMLAISVDSVERACGVNFSASAREIRKHLKQP